MAVAYESIGSGTSTTTSLTVTKPTGLAEGDLMLAGIVVEYGGGNTTTVNTPSGWTKISAVNVAADCELASFYKVADSSDVAASNFTFTATAIGFGEMIGNIVRISDYGIIAGNDEFAESNSSTTLTISGGFTPTRSNTLFVGFLSKSSTISTGDFTAIALATDDPTWTERTDAVFGNGSGSYDTRLAVYTASRSAATATGNITLTNVASDNARYLGIVVSVAPSQSGSVTPTTTVNAYSLSPIQSCVIDAIVDAPTIDTRKSTTWQRPTKSSTTWYNQSK